MERVEIGDAVLYLGDCAEFIAELPRKNVALISDVPYGMDWDLDLSRFSGGNTDRGEARDWGADRIEGDAEPFDPTPWLQWPEVIIWGCNHYSDKLPPGGMLVWLKKHPAIFGTFLSDCEVAWRKGSRGVFAHYEQFPPPSRAKEAGGRAAHPTQKPIGLMEWCIGMTKAPLVIDPYMGSGTTLVAAIKQGRKAIGIEKKPEFFAAAVRRVEEAVKDAAEAARQHDMFVAPAAKPVQTALFGGEAA